MYAVIVTGGKQYKVSEGDVLYIEKLNAEADAEITFDTVLASTTPRRVIASVRVIVSLIPRLRSLPSRHNDFH